MTIRASKPAFNIREKLKELTQSIGLKGRELIRAATAQEARTLISAGRRNILINGAMRVAQRSTSESIAGTQGYNTVDRWRTSLSSVGTWTEEQDTDAPPGFEYSLKYSCTATQSIVSSSFFVTYQYIEANNCQVMQNNVRGSHPLTLSFWVKASKTGTASWEIEQRNNSSRRYITSYTINNPNTWEKKVIRIPADADFAVNYDNSTGIRIGWWWNSGATYNTGDHGNSWSAASNPNRNAKNFGLGTSTSDYVAITGVQLEVGENATEFEHRSYGEELALCQRYYYQIGSSVGGSSGSRVLGPAYTPSTNELAMAVFHPTTMRDRPTCTIFNSSASNLSKLRFRYTGNNNFALSSSGTILNNYMTPEGGAVWFQNLSHGVSSPGEIRTNESNGGSESTFLRFSAELN